MRLRHIQRALGLPGFASVLQPSARPSPLRSAQLTVPVDPEHLAILVGLAEVLEPVGLDFLRHPLAVFAEYFDLPFFPSSFCLTPVWVSIDCACSWASDGGFDV